MTKTKSSMLYGQLKKEILGMKYDLGQAISEQEIAMRYGVSKTPVREALSVLVQEGYLVKYPHRGYFLKEIRLEEYYQIVQLRFILESGIMRHIIASCTDEEIDSLKSAATETYVLYEDYDLVNQGFHMAMAGLTRNKYICDSLQHVFELSGRKIAHEYFKTIQHDVHRDHRVIIDTLRARDTNRVIELLRQELRRCDDPGSWL